MKPRYTAAWVGSTAAAIFAVSAGGADGAGTPLTMDGTYSWGDGLAYDVRMDIRASRMQTLQDAPTIRMPLVDGGNYRVWSTPAQQGRPHRRFTASGGHG